MLTQSLTHLLDEAARGRLSIFVGAALPRAITGLPSNADLARDLASHFVQSPDRNASFFAVAQQAGRIHYGEIIQFLIEHLLVAGQPPQPIDMLLARLPLDLFITTRYDDLLEKAFDRIQRPLTTVTTDLNAGRPRRDRATLVKLYGDLRQPDTLIITEDDLFTVAARKPRVTNLVQQALSGTTLFLGYDLDSPDFLNLWLNLLKPLGRFAPVAYAATDVATTATDRQLWRERNIELLAESPLSILNALSDRLPALLPAPRTDDVPPPPLAPEPPVQTYRDFDLELAYTEEGDLRVRILRSSAGEDTAQPEVMTDLPSSLDGVTSLTGLDAEIGAQLLPRSVGKRWAVNLALAEAAQEGLRLRLFVQDESLAAIPWEAAKVDGQRLALNPLTPLVRYVSAPRATKTMQTKWPVRLLIVLSAARDPGLPPLDLAAERSLLTEALAPLQQRGKLQIHWLESLVTRRALLDAFRQQQPHLLHFVGHGAYDAESAEGALLLTGRDGDDQLDWLTTADLSLIVQGSPLRFALLNACQTGRAAGGMAQMLVQSVLPAALGMQANIPDRAAVAFAGAFYRALADGWPIDAATVEGRRLLALESGLDAPWWALPVLYLRGEDGHLFG